ncbi:hypothetical protein [uncultured Stenotrophomonas sp.]|uniref:hypothetical protein n=1 Tax=uncultured Stenotrophomonas sp. TaxID=165438 RepID=UPI0028D47021|nr:hypothetical protein [uncultured Stenotrophomonas sp.]
MGVFQKIKDFLTGAGFGGVANAPLVVKCNQQPVASMSVDDLVRENDIEEIRRRLLKCNGWEVAWVFKTALEYGDRLEILNLAANANEHCFIMHLRSLDPDRPDFEKNVDIALSLVGMGVLDRRIDIGDVLAKLSYLAFNKSSHARIEQLIVAIIHRCSDLCYTMLLDQLTHSPAEAVHDVLRIMYENGCNFHGGPPVAPETFFFNNCTGLISDLIEWGVCVERPSHQYNGQGIRAVAYIHSEIDEGERRIAERDAANITQALADDGLVQSEDTPKPKRKM